jgi:ATP-dependent DNA helicase RecG
VFKAIIPIQTGQATGQVTGQVREEVQKVIRVLDGEMKLKELMESLELSHRENFINNYLEPSMNSGFIELKYPDSPNHPNQKYRLTSKGEKLKKEIGLS